MARLALVLLVFRFEMRRGAAVHQMDSLPVEGPGWARPPPLGADILADIIPSIAGTTKAALLQTIPTSDPSRSRACLHPAVSTSPIQEAEAEEAGAAGAGKLGALLPRSSRARVAYLLGAHAPVGSNSTLISTGDSWQPGSGTTGDVICRGRTVSPSGRDAWNSAQAVDKRKPEHRAMCGAVSTIT